jgi:hypothetical protein
MPPLRVCKLLTRGCCDACLLTTGMKPAATTSLTLAFVNDIADLWQA